MLNYTKEIKPDSIKITVETELPGEKGIFDFIEHRKTDEEIQAYIKSCQKDLFTRWLEYYLKRLKPANPTSQVHHRADKALKFFMARNTILSQIKRLWPEIEKPLHRAIPDDQPELITMHNKINDFVKTF